MSLLAILPRLLGRFLRLRPPRVLTLRILRWLLRFGAREFAFQYAFIDAAVLVFLFATGGVTSTAGTVAAVVFALLFGLEARFAWASWRSATAVDAELADLPAEPEASRFPRTHLAFPLLMLFASSVRHVRGVVFHREGRHRVRLDVYLPKAEPRDGELRPAVIQVHGGGWIVGSRLEQGIPLLNHLASNGWVGFNVDYSLSPRATMPEHVIDVKRAIAWVREHAEAYRIDPKRICLTGGSAGGHLTALAALTADDRSLQPGFEEANTSVAAAVPFYGLYDLLDADLQYPGIRDWLIEEVVFKRSREADPEAFRAASPPHRVHPEAPPFLIIHGEHDTIVPVEDGRRFARRLEEVSRNAVRYVELPGADHAFDVFPSLRTAHIVEGIERFLRTVVGPPAGEPNAGSSEQSDATAILSNS